MVIFPNSPAPGDIDVLQPANETERSVAGVADCFAMVLLGTSRHGARMVYGMPTNGFTVLIYRFPNASTCSPSRRRTIEGVISRESARPRPNRLAAGYRVVV